jgi:hypothetical protein
MVVEKLSSIDIAKKQNRSDPSFFMSVEMKTGLDIDI